MVKNYSYKFKYKKKFSFFWKSFKVIGHKLDNDQDKMILYFEDGSIREISEWKFCECKLGPDWELAMQSIINKEAGKE